MIRNSQRSSSLILRLMASYVSVLCVLTGALGIYFYHSVRSSQEQRIETIVSGRARYYARLVSEMYPLGELKERPLLIAKMLGAERDVLAFRHPSGEVMIEVNPDGISLPPPAVAASSTARTVTSAGIEVYWTSVQTKALDTNEPIEVVAGHPMTDEQAMLATFRDRFLMATIAGVIVATAIAYGLLRRGLLPVRDMATRAAEIHPGQLHVRLDVLHAPTELRALAGAFNAMLDRLTDGYQRLSQFSADLAHEIRTPLGVLIGQTQVTLAQPRTVDEYKSVLESNLEEFEHLNRLSENMLFLARADEGRQPVDKVTVDMDRELHKIADYFEGLALERDMRFSIEAAGVANVSVDLFRRAVGNLVVNAIRHGREGTTVRLRAASAGDKAIIEVENEGVSLSPDQFDRLFDRFYRVDAARSGSSSSHGLGLAIVDAIMRLHAGLADISCPEEGMIRFRLSFPV
ncbi:heavy metal sensor histidine kinase [Rhizobium laguerreae]|uniref:Sensor protein n=1 Tax=Rhizobium laguerreae TaxID=1076926 RepID=A0AAX2QK96_9HYPH|nr:heavy metal sensor histidine kinase [Rhizobium laguerreae]MBY3527012.1 heavy metal sensor histidine kinase [Rhizobium laguerreae]NKM32647.1 heavy metal sensor histidine kinase [Rhizobium laguerreae]TCU23270.1 two-component system heavy metal sensor histidine kinase CusS [Rhizobium laguerreae]